MKSTRILFLIAHKSPQNHNNLQTRRLSSLARFEETVRIRTCTHVYSTQRDNFLFKKCPKNGIDIDVKYIDTASASNLNSSNSSNLNSSNNSMPTVLALHGAPGTFGDYSSLANYLTAR